MSNNYVNYYIEILSNTLNDAILRNISLQANAKITEESINNHSVQVEELTGIINNLKNELETVKLNNANDRDSYVTMLNADLEEAKNTINELNVGLLNYNSLKSEYDSVKHLANNVDTFRNELVKERAEHQKAHEKHSEEVKQIHEKYSEEVKQIHEKHNDDIKQLNDKIAYLQLTPAKRKKIDEANKVSLLETVEVPEEPKEPEITKDGGSF